MKITIEHNDRKIIVEDTVEVINEVMDLIYGALIADGFCPETVKRCICEMAEEYEEDIYTENDGESL